MNITFGDLKVQYSYIGRVIDTAIQNVIDKTAFIKGKYVQQFLKKTLLMRTVLNTASAALTVPMRFISLIREGRFGKYPCKFGC